MDVKSAFLYGTIKEEVYVCQPLGFKDPDYPDKRNNRSDLVHQEAKGDILLVQVYVDDIIFGSTNKELYDKSASTPIDTEKPLLKDPDGEDVDVNIYRYLKGKPHLGLWNPKDSPFNLVAYYDSDYAGASLDRKSTTGGCQFPGCRLISWLIITAVIYKLMLLGLKKDVVHLILLDDVDGIDCLPNEEIFAELTRMGYDKPSTKLTFYKAFFSAQWKFLIHMIVQCMSAKRTAWNEFSSSMASAVICLATVMINAQVNDLSFYNTKYTSPALTQKVFANMKRIGKGFSGVDTPLFDNMLVQTQVHDVVEVEEDDDNEVSDVSIPPSPTPATTPPPPQQEPILSPPQAQSAQPSSPPQ
nr:uncharacterized mitochondrial protein AtMg00810-like [Tanacetum cinerariifolium]